MRTVTYRLVDLQNATLNLGHAGENQRTRIMFDSKKLFEEYPAALPSLTVKPPVGDTYPAVVTKEGYCVYWDITDSDLIHDGIGEAQLTFTENDVKVKTYITKTKITRSLDPVGQIPTPIENWIKRADDILDEAQAAAEAAESAAEHQPKIENGYWYVWNGTEYVQNVKAQGEDGAPGQDGKDGKDGADGQPGADGLDGVDATPALITVDYEDLVYPVAAGTTCYHNGEMFVAKEAIQTAGAWDSSKWDKTTVEEQVSQLKSGIQGKYTKPSGGIPSTDMTQAVQDSLSAADSALIGVGKSEERDGIVQTGDTATRNITKDRYVIWKGGLYTASANIVTGETLSLSNLDPVSDGGFNALRDEIEKKHSIKAYKKYVQQEQSTGYVWIQLDNIVEIEDGDEIEIIIYQSDTSQGTRWSNTDQWNNIAVQNRSETTIPVDIPYLNGTKPAEIIIKKAQGYAITKAITNDGIQLKVPFPNNFDSVRRIQLDPVSSTLVAGCTVVITVRKTI